MSWTDDAAQPRRVREALGAAAGRFTFSATPRLDAELLMAHALGVSRERLLLRHLDDPAPHAFAALVERRADQEPVAYITGSRAFWTIDLAVGPGALVPRADSETLIEAAVDHFGARMPARILDLGTGPGTLLLAALDQWPAASGLGVDRSTEALAMAQGNAVRLGSATRAVFRIGDWAAGIDERFDLVLANPPYIGTGEPLPPEVRGWEPAGALFAGADGLDDYRRIVPDLPRLLAPGGAAVLEIGASQEAAVSALLRQAGLEVNVRHDLAGHPRALIAT
ncbi:peptide chain release factor N(5)-glutamine methyltransferase [Sphingomonas aracearum]|uniref:Release factor glutamine methyltransferase n=1 Tax=Sphingomonas aracearum TaxID=2283317 RepID=A0A369VS54_9SPHN|nr:peptide chain release factor N(5)-glutamine methyltransferase [Sphingomonas aracearum]RDE04505.1 peptide chain release factor N(5)-glutamine methyltransferase [Sphingomonas aracearum]